MDGEALLSGRSGALWFVIQTKTGEESRVVSLIQGLGTQDREIRCIVPLFEQVERSATSYQLRLRRLFPGYILLDTDEPEEVNETLRRVPEFTRILGTKEEDGRKTFIPIEEEDRQFLNTLLRDGMVHLSYVHMKKSRMDRVIGPLAEYAGNIVKLDIQHRRAIVEKDILGKHRKICFGLWIDGDPENAWIRKQIDSGNTGVIHDQDYDIGMHEGDMVRGINGVYEENKMKVLSVDAARRIADVEVELFGRKLNVPMLIDNLEKL